MAADCPEPPAFQAFTLAVAGYVVALCGAWEGFQQFTGFSLAGYPARRLMSNRLHSHLNDVRRMWAIKFGTKQLRKIVINPHGMIRSKLSRYEKADELPSVSYYSRAL